MKIKATTFKELGVIKDGNGNPLHPHSQFISALYNVNCEMNYVLLFQNHLESIYAVETGASWFNEISETTEWYGFDLIRIWEEKDGLCCETISGTHIPTLFKEKAEHHTANAISVTEEDDRLPL